MSHNQTILYIDYSSLIIPEKRRRQLNGACRFAKARGWDVDILDCGKFQPSELSSILALRKPVGCIDDCSDDRHHLPPRLFGSVPVIYLDPPKRLPWQGARTVVCDNAAIARMAFRELSSGLPPAYAVIGFFEPRQWARERVDAFRAICQKAGKPCIVFSYVRGEDEDARIARLARWVASLPQHCAVFAVNDPAAREAALAFRAAGRHLPRTATLVGADAMAQPRRDEPYQPFSSVKIDFELAGYLAARALGEMVSRRVAEEAESQGNKGGSLSRKATLRPRSGHLSGEAALIGGDGAAVASFGPLLVERRESTRGFGRREPGILRAVDMIRAEACDGLTAAKLAARFPGSRNLFERRFREAMGRSILDEIIAIRLEKVIALLARPEVPIGAIAAFCGFSSDIALRKLFRSRTGISMRQWRANHLR
jgi:LacI family transcriptional regulator